MGAPDATIVGEDFSLGFWKLDADTVMVAEITPKGARKDSAQMGQLLKGAMEAQLEGVFSDLEGAIKWVGNGLNYAVTED